MLGEERVGIGDARELPQKLRTALGNRSISVSIPSLQWGALLLRAIGFRFPTPEEGRLLEGYVETINETGGLTAELVAKGFRHGYFDPEKFRRKGRLQSRRRHFLNEQSSFWGSSPLYEN